MNTTDRVNMKLSSDDLESLRVIAADIQRRRRSPFVSPADCIREALRIAKERVIADGMKAASQGAAQ